jgi:Thioredoxin
MSDAWVVSYVLLWICVVALGIAVVALLRQVGVLHARIAPMGTHFAGEGPDIGSVAPQVGLDWSRAPLSLVVFTSATCTICRELKPSIEAMRKSDPTLVVHSVDLEQHQAIFTAFNVRSTPYVITVSQHATVLGRGVANTLEQIEELVREARLDIDGKIDGAHA